MNLAEFSGQFNEGSVMDNKQRFKEFEKEPFLLKFMGGYCSDGNLYEKYSKSFEHLLLVVRVAVESGAMSEKEGKALLKRCRK